MNLLIWVCLGLAAWPSAFALYYTGIKEVFQPPTKNNRNNSYFGYSITYDESKKKLVISAPRISDIGEVYDCNIGNRACAKIPRDIIKRDTGIKNKTYTHDFWFGATVMAGRDYVLMCAPRYTEYTMRKSVNDGFGAYVTQGRCYSYKENVLTLERIINEKERIQDSPSPLEATMDSFGWSIDVAIDDSVIVGGPGMFHGRAMIYDKPGTIPKLIRSSKHIPKFNFGYAVASGTFVNTELSFAVGSPYGSGEVTFYKRVQYLRKLNKQVDTELIGSMFGSVLCAAKMYGTRTDLLVGAPTYAEKNKYNLGAVYVYLAKTLKQPPQFCRRIVGQASGSMFGSAIVNVGDLNGDKKDEIAIGAPFEKDGRGVVYLYSGAHLSSSKVADNDLKYLQKIEPEPSYGESFGMSLTPLLDFDENGCKELAIGSPYKDTVVLLRCMAAVVVKTSVVPPPLQGRSNQTNFDLDVCLEVTYPSLPQLVEASILTTVEMNHDHAKLLDIDSKGHVKFTTNMGDKKSKYCKKVPFYLPEDGKYGTEIHYTIFSELQNDPMKLMDFKSSRVVLSDNSVLSIQRSMWAAECAGNKICVPDLTLNISVSFDNPVHPYIIGSTDIETINITMHNDGEVAYDSCVRLHIKGANVLQPGGCVYEFSTDGDRLKCEPPKPLWNKTSWTTGHIKLEMTRLTNLDENINITKVLYNRCNDNNTVVRRPDEKKLYPVRAYSRGITAKGETDIGDIVHMAEKDMKDIGKKIKHIYTIRNNGTTNWVDLPVSVTLQTQPFIKYDSVTVYFFTTENEKVYTPCSFQSQNATSMTYTCVVGNLMAKKEFATILIPISILPGTLEGLLDKDKNVTTMSSVELKVTADYNYAARVDTTIVLQVAEVPFETIIISVVVGLCILIIIALILYRIGFLQRKKREELQKLRKSVKRQTILRRSTMPSHSSSAEDRRQILEDMQKEDEHDHPQAK